MMDYSYTQINYTASLYVFEQMHSNGLLTDAEFETVRKYLVEKYHPLII